MNLYKKANELSTLCGARVAIVTISEKGELTMYPNSETVIQRYLTWKKRTGKSNSAGSSKGLKKLRVKKLQKGEKKQPVVEAAAAELTQTRDQVLNVAAEEGGTMAVMDLNQDLNSKFD
ncbi:Transcription factor, MADS-box [Corchorus capsularis]|uniref:Transcription factor, MADS-box n=1 Tax=Corchorus capsularis TaxID=210143 RepID=A0A1R3H632_COCAP|nr:Transcription factor, MADS-box [Corchorus capsularis]